MQIQPRNFANRPFSSNSSTFHRDSSIKKSRLIANRPTLSLSEKYLYKTIRFDIILYYSFGGYISIDKPSGGNISETHLNPRQFALFKYGFNRYSSCWI